MAGGRLACLVALGALASLGGATAAGATVPDPQTTNVPYVAWRGEQLKLVKCGLPAGADRADYLVEEWSGSSQRDPQIEPSSVSVSGGCARGDVVSLTDGLARVKLIAYNGSTAVDKHQFLAIWLSLGTPTVREVADPGNTLAGTKAELGDPSGDGNFNPGSKPGRLEVELTGSFPHPLGPAGRFTLPSDWAALANALATDTLDGNPANDAMRWDIHDTQSALPDVHVPGFCGPGLVTRDQVDDCQGGGDLGPFSRVFGDGAAGAAGPFDPQRLGSLLSDGALDADDAPMPAARVDLQIAQNSGGATDVSGAGGFAKADKSNVDSRDHNGSSAKHNLYAPYYVQWIPATSAGGNASGVDGPAQGNNFEGFLVDGAYDNWDIARVNTPSVSADTKCNRLVGQPRRTPAGPRDVAIYTDEHGEAQVSFNPNTGFYFDALRDAHGNSLTNLNGGCDLQGVATLGTASISATARYPYQPVSDTPKTSNAVTKTIGNLFSKTLTYVPKGAGAENQSSRIVVAHANDIDGSAFANEKVCFYPTGDIVAQVNGFSGTVPTSRGPLYVDGSDAGRDGIGVCRNTDRNGNAAVELLASHGSVDLVAWFKDEGLLRHIDVPFGTPTSGGSTSPNGPFVPGSNGLPTPISHTTGSVYGAVYGAGSHAPADLRQAAKHAHKASKKAYVRSARVVRLKGGKRVLVVHVRSSKVKARIAVKMYGKHKHVMKRATRTVRTNRNVRVKHLAIGKSVRTIRVAIVR